MMPAVRMRATLKHMVRPAVTQRSCNVMPSTLVQAIGAVVNLRMQPLVTRVRGWGVCTNVVYMSIWADCSRNDACPMHGRDLNARHTILEAAALVILRARRAIGPAAALLVLKAVRFARLRSFFVVIG
jgi:hypothetical protein